MNILLNVNIDNEIHLKMILEDYGLIGCGNWWNDCTFCISSDWLDGDIDSFVTELNQAGINTTLIIDLPD